MTNKINLRDLLWLISLYIVSIIPFTRDFFRSYEERIRLLETEIVSANNAIKFERAAKNKYTDYYWWCREELGKAADYWTKYGEKRARKEAVRSFANLEWLDHPSFTPEEKLHAAAIKEAIVHSMGIGMRLDMRIRQLREREVQEHKEWLASGAGKKHLVSINDACRLMTKDSEGSNKQKEELDHLTLHYLYSHKIFGTLPPQNGQVSDGLIRRGFVEQIWSRDGDVIKTPYWYVITDAGVKYMQKHPWKKRQNKNFEWIDV